MSPLTTPAADVRPEGLRWLWRDRIPLGKLTLLAGDGGLGKSTLTIALAAQLSHGSLDGELKGEAAGTLILSTEDDAADTIVPRLMAAGADLSRVHVQAEDPESGYAPVSLPDDQEALVDVVETLGVRLVVFDPLTAFLSERVDSFKDQSVRRALGPVTAFARQRGVAVVGIMHLNRREGAEVSSRISGSSGFRNAARSVLIFGADPDDPEAPDGSRRVIAQEKANLSRPGLASVVCRIEGATVRAANGASIETSRLVIVGNSTASARDVLARRGADRAEDRSQAEVFLMEALANGARLSREVEGEGAPLGLTPKMLRTARQKLGVVVSQRGRAWWWELPGTSPGPSAVPVAPGAPESSGAPE